MVDMPSSAVSEVCLKKKKRKRNSGGELGGGEEGGRQAPVVEFQHIFARGNVTHLPWVLSRANACSEHMAICVFTQGRFGSSWVKLPRNAFLADVRHVVRVFKAWSHSCCPVSRPLPAIRHCRATASDKISSYESRQTLTSPSDSVLCLMRIAHAGFLSDT